MKMISQAVLLATLVTWLPATASAQHYSLQHFDDLTFTAMANARGLRWEIHNEFTDSRDRDHLIQDVDRLISDLHSLQRSIYSGRSPRALLRDLDAALEEISSLKGHLNECDFALHRGPRLQSNVNGYVFLPETLHPGRRHVDHAIQMLGEVERNLGELHHELVALTGVRGPQVTPPPVVIPKHPAIGPAPLLPAPAIGPTSKIGTKKKVSAISEELQSKRFMKIPNPAGSYGPPRPFTELGAKWVHTASLTTTVSA